MDPGADLNLAWCADPKPPGRPAPLHWPDKLHRERARPSRRGTRPDTPWLPGRPAGLARPARPAYHE